MRTQDRISAPAGSCSRLTASDSDRERVLDMLKMAFVQGRLTKHEFDVRVGQTLLAPTLGDLTAVIADIRAWSIPQPVPRPAKATSPPAHPVVKAVACVIIALAATALAELPGMSTLPVQRHMRVAACHAFYDWTADLSDVSTLNRAVNDARQGSDSALAAELMHLRQAYLRYERLSASPQSAAPRRFVANHVRDYGSRVASGCQAPGR